MSTPATSSEAQTPARAQTAVAEVAPKFVAAAALLSTLAYAAGWWLERTYYAALGCDWFFPNLTPTHIAAAGVPILSVMALFAAVTGVALIAGVRVRTIEWAAVSCVSLCSAGFVAVALWWAPKSFDLLQLQLLLQGSTWASSGAAATMVLRSFLRGELFEPRRVMFLLLAVLTSLFGTSIYASLLATHELDPAHSTLARLARVDARDWRLVTIVGDLALATALDADAGHRTFTVFKVDASTPLTMTSPNGLALAAFPSLTPPSPPARQR